MDRAFEIYEELDDGPGIARASLHAAELAERESEERQRSLHESLRRHRELGDSWGISQSLNLAVHTSFMTDNVKGNIEEVESMLAEAAEHNAEHGDPQVIAHTNQLLAWLQGTKNMDVSVRRKSNMELIRHCEDHRLWGGLAVAYWTLGEIELQEGKLYEAEIYEKRSVEIGYRRDHLMFHFCNPLVRLALIKQEKGELKTAATIAAAACAIRVRYGAELTGEYVDTMDAISNRLPSNDFEACVKAGEAMSEAEAVDYALNS